MKRMVLKDLSMTYIAAAWYAFIDCDTEAWANLQLRKRAPVYLQKYFWGVERARLIFFQGSWVLRKYFSCTKYLEYAE